MWFPLLMHRTRGLSGVMMAKHANQKNTLSKSSGAAIALEIVDPTFGSEIVINGNFDDGTTGWTGLDVIDGVARTVSTTGYQVISTVAATEYRLTFLCDAKGVSPQLQIQNGNVTGSPVIAEVNPSGNTGMKGYQATFTALGIDSIIILSNGSNTALWDNISIKEIL